MGQQDTKKETLAPREKRENLEHRGRESQGERGPKGDKGDPFAIAKTFPSVASMIGGFTTDGVKEGQFVMIDTGNIEDTDNAKLYVKGKTTYAYITDLSGATGMTDDRDREEKRGQLEKTEPRVIKEMRVLEA